MAAARLSRPCGRTANRSAPAAAARLRAVVLGATSAAITTGRSGSKARHSATRPARSGRPASTARGGEVRSRATMAASSCSGATR